MTTNLTQGSDEWKDARIGKISASVAAGCLGLNPYMSRQKAWRMILGTEPDRPNAFTAWGNTNESVCRDRYTFMTRNLVEITGLWSHPFHDWLVASPDGLTGEDGLFEGKCPQNLPGAIPIYHKIQCLVQLAVTQRSWVDYCAMSPKGDLFVCRVQRQGIDGLIEKLHKFYLAYVVAKKEPERRKPRRKRNTPYDVAEIPLFQQEEMEKSVKEALGL